MPAELRILITAFIAVTGLLFTAGDRAWRAKARADAPVVKHPGSAAAPATCDRTPPSPN